MNNRQLFSHCTWNHILLPCGLALHSRSVQNLDMASTSMTLARASLSDAVTAPSLKLTVSLSPDATPQQALSAVDAVCAALQKQEVSVEHLRVLLGRLLAEIQDRQLYSPTYDTFEAFILSLSTRFRIKRSSAYESLMIVRRLPNLTPEDSQNVPLTNLSLVARAARTAQPRTVTALLKEAKRLPVMEFREQMESRGLVGKRGRPTVKSSTVTLRIKVPRSLAAKWVAYVGEENPGSALAALMKEVAA